MKELTQVRDAVAAALARAGVTALPAFPAERAKAYPGAVATVAVGAAEGRPLGFCSYLGERADPETGAVRERYGKQLEGVISVDVRAERAAVCEQGCEAASEALLGDLPPGVRPGELRWGALTWERATGLFLRRGAPRCPAGFPAGRRGGGAGVLGFFLRGAVKHE